MKRSSLIVSLLFVMPIARATWAEETVRQLPLDEKVGQLLMIDVYSNLSEKHIESVENLIKTYHIGNVIFFQGNIETQIAWTNRLQAAARLPLLVGQDCEWGLSQRLANTLRFPKNMTLGALQDESLIYEVGKEIGKQCCAIGVHLDFAPVVDINNNPDNPIIGIRSFGSNKEDVARKGVLFAQGLQAGGVLACAKHFPGHGDTAVDSHEDLPVLHQSYERLINEELYPFRAMIDAKVPVIMTAHLSIPVLDKTPHQPSTLSRFVVTDLLRKELEFKGLIVTDAMNMKGVAKFYEPGTAVLQAILAGNDMVVMPMDVPAAVVCIKQAVADGVLSVQELDEHVLHVLQAKERVGLHNNRFVDASAVQEILYSDDAKRLKKTLYEQAITIIRDEQNLLPIKNMKQIGLLQVGGQHDNSLTNMFGRYLQISAVPTEEEVARVIDLLEQYETIIVVLYAVDKTMGFFGRIDSMSEQLKYLFELMNSLNKKTCVLACLSPYCLKFLTQQKTVIMAYENDPEAVQAGLDVIGGKFTPTGKVPISKTF